MPASHEHRRRDRSPPPCERRGRSRSPERTPLRIYRDRSRSPPHSTSPSSIKENHDSSYTRGRRDSYRSHQERHYTSRRHSSSSNKENKHLTFTHHHTPSSSKEGKNYTTKPTYDKLDSYRPSKEFFEILHHTFTSSSKVAITKLSETCIFKNRVTNNRVTSHRAHRSKAAKLTASNPKISKDKITKHVKPTKAKVPFKRAESVYVPPHPDLPLPSIEDPTIVPIDRTQPKNFENMPLTCFFWKVNGKCKHSDGVCPYAHWDTGYYAVAPVAGNELEAMKKALEDKEAELKAREEALAKTEARACLCEDCGKKLAGRKA